ncbi:unnamed protein product [Ilex paraguariensis]|uniref:Uncharacterized protein n=1 Tax=Ilex paraguariensis TaxID=185542 RepID=A0ABC8SZ23_9AQUA
MKNSAGDGDRSKVVEEGRKSEDDQDSNEIRPYKVKYLDEEGEDAEVMVEVTTLRRTRLQCFRDQLQNPWMTFRSLQLEGQKVTNLGPNARVREGASRMADV